MEIAFDIETTGLDPIKNRITMIGLKTYDDELIITHRSEKRILEMFWDYLRKNEVYKLIGFNIRAFDIPFLITRTFKHRVEAVNLRYKLFDLRPAFNYYYNRYGKGTLEDYSKMVDMGAKYKGIKSEQIPELWKQKKIQTLKKYLLQDIRMTWAVYLRFKQNNLAW